MGCRKFDNGLILDGRGAFQWNKQQIVVSADKNIEFIAEAQSFINILYTIMHFSNYSLGCNSKIICGTVRLNAHCTWRTACKLKPLTGSSFIHNVQYIYIYIYIYLGTGTVEIQSRVEFKSDDFFLLEIHFGNVTELTWPRASSSLFKCISITNISKIQLDYLNMRHDLCSQVYHAVSSGTFTSRSQLILSH